MSTVNISLPEEQVSFVDNLIGVYGFANRSEFMRALLRLISYKPEILEKAAVFPFVAPKTNSIPKILTDFRRTQKYSPAFIKDLKTGLEASDYFKK